METKFYITIEVTAQLCGSMGMTPDDKREIRGRIIDYIHGENQKCNHACATCYIHGENVLSINDEKGNVL